MRVIASSLIFISLIFAELQIPYAQDQTAVESEEQIELRSREIGRALRCVVCQNQSIEESDASLAEDMRNLVRSRVRKGETNSEVINFMQDRYGDFVLLKPPVQGNTYVLWVAPFVIVLLGMLWFTLQTRRQQKDDIAPLSEDEIEHLENLQTSNPKTAKTQGTSS